MKGHDKPSSLKDYQLALFSRAVFDIPPRTRRLLVIAGVGGIVILTMECLVGRQDHTVPLDKIIHFSGYCVLSLTFVLALRPILFGPGLVGLVLIEENTMDKIVSDVASLQSLRRYPSQGTGPMASRGSCRKASEASNDGRYRIVGKRGCHGTHDNSAG